MYKGVGVPEHMDTGALSPSRTPEVYQTHVNNGVELLSTLISGAGGVLEEFAPALSLVKNHHAINGYPEGVKVEDTTLVEKLTSVADIFDALIANSFSTRALAIQEKVRFTNEGLSPFEAKRIILGMVNAKAGFTPAEIEKITTFLNVLTDRLDTNKADEGMHDLDNTKYRQLLVGAAGKYDHRAFRDNRFLKALKVFGN
jgi:HD-GYP domain-containing protein (c-di-GMP phosphodiesterase class II)